MLGDDPRWANAALDDAAWESIDMTPDPGSHDADVGLTGYVPGWSARGHSGYSGYAWYRLKTAISAPPEMLLALAGPPDVDSAYQVDRIRTRIFRMCFVFKRALVGERPK
jgi:hypothetical protein